MMRSLFSGVSGLKNHQTRMDVIGNNISNVNTTGFKSSRVTFADTLNQNLSGATGPKDNIGGTNPKQVGLGSGIATVDLLFTDGTVQNTGKNTDLSLSGNGLFVVKNGNQTYYTRNGAFEFDANGNYVMPGSGMLVQGWMAQEDGTLVTNGEPGTITVPAGKSMDASATTTVTYANNLNSAMPTIVSANGGEELKTSFTEDGATVTCGSEYNPVYLTLEDGSVVTASTNNSAWSYGYTIDTAGSGITVGSNDVVTLTCSDGYVGTGTTGSTYTVGGYVNGATVSTSGSQVTATPTNPVTLTMSDGSTHVATSGNFTVGLQTLQLDSYDVNGDLIEGYVTAYSVSHEISSIGVENVGGGTGTTFHVGGTAKYTTSTTGDTATASTSIPVTVKMGNGYSFSGVDGTKYTVGDLITSPAVSSGSFDVTSTNSGSVTFKLANGDTVSNMPSGTYSIGQNYSYTQSPYTWKATTDNPITITIGANTYHATSGNLNETLTSIYDMTGGDGPFTVTGGGLAGTSTITVQGNSGNTYNITIDETGGFAADVPAGTEIGVNGGDWSGTEITSQIVSYTVTGTVSSLTTTYDIISAEGVYGYTASKDNPVTLTMSDGSTVKETAGKYVLGTGLPVTTTATVYDTLGNSFSVPIYFTKTETSSVTGNTWTVSVAIDGSGTNTLTGDDGSTTTISMPDTELHFDTDGHYTSGESTVTLTLTNGAGETQNVQINLNALTQFSGSNTVNGTHDGYAAGTLESISIDSSGVITGTYTNGERRNEAQVAVAQFTNASGLTKTGDSLYQSSSNSGTPNVKTATDLGVKITPSALEMSNVDIANEFADMIVTQRGFQSNSKMITVGDEMLETVINMKR
ncbi:flagellar hook-basal body complex protein [Selenomonas sp. KH1T6]|uniref:flagellar hook-basal body complex protein n=1 Tax=Selenomonas sp. KH1T6 TaxID=3158784 RepID=UPI0008A7FB7F|nr:flagellar hook protein FlgE [Selenomonas ruminantium]